GIDEGRNTIQGPRSTEAPELVEALARVQQEVTVQPDIDFRVGGAARQEPVLPAVWQQMYRIGREALLKPVRHARPEHAELRLQYADGDLRLRVRDNGCGIDPQVLDTGREGHWGLAGMRERATGIGGLLKISSDATTGTEVQLSIPSGIAFHASTDHN